MSLNWREIDCLLAEIPLEGSFIRQIHQPSHQSLYLECYNRGRSFDLFFSFSNRFCRLHLLSARPANPPKPPRFATFLRSHLRGGRVLKAHQVGRERIIKLEISKGEQVNLLWARLWGAAANMIATDPQGKILDAFYRRPKRKEVSGGVYQPEASLELWEAGDKNHYTIRQLPHSGTFNQKIEAHYRQLEEEEEHRSLLARLTQQLESQENKILTRLENLKGRQKEYEDHEQWKSFGDLILSNLHTIKPGDRWLQGQGIHIELDPRVTPAANAERYYKRYRKARTAARRLGEEIQDQEQRLQKTRRRMLELQDRPDVQVLKREIKPRQQPSRRPGGSPGLVFYSAGFQILVGRTARENDVLLRRFVRGNDAWFHCRDYPGAYVFVKHNPGKSIPLPVMLDAGNLALYYSKGKSSGQGDVYYTQVKFLRRARQGKMGLVIPTQEKNLHISLDENRLKGLRSTI